MKLLSRYVNKHVLAAIGFVILVLVGLQLFILFVGELDSIGVGNYSVVKALGVVLLKTPQQVYDFFPVACVLGALIGLGSLASHSELIVMRASGVSVAHIIKWVVSCAFVLIITVTLLGELMVPKLNYSAENLKARATSRGRALRTLQGVWIKQGDHFIHINTVNSKTKISGIRDYGFNADLSLNNVLVAKIAELKNNTWHLKHAQLTQVNASQLKTHDYNDLIWQQKIAPAVLSLTSTSPDEMSLKALYKTISLEKQNGIQVPTYALEFWQRLMQPLASLVMIFLAIPFIFGPLRTATMGSRIMAGATVGFGFHILNRFFGPLSVVYHLPPVMAAVMPTLIFACLAAFLMVKRR